MKVLQINSFFSAGGPPRIVNGIYDVLKSEGIECKIAAAREKVYAEADSIRIGSKVGVYMNALKARLLDNEGFNAVRDTQRLIQQIKEYNPDIIHLHNLHGYYINVEILFDYLRQCGKPIVWTLHDCWAMTGHCAYFEAAKCNQWKTACINCTQLKTYPVSVGAGRVGKNYALKQKCFSGIENLTIVTPSAWLAEYVKQSLLSEYDVKVIHNGISLQQFSGKKGSFIERHNLQGKRILLGVAQVWNERKGFNDFLKLAEMLNDEFKIVLVGLSQKQINELPSSILGIERTNSVEELAEIYSSSDIFVNFTYEDNFPTVNIESLACGTPVLTYKTGGSPEAIDDTCGWVVEQGDLHSAVQIIKNMQDKSRYTESCIKRSKKFDRDARYREYIELYTELLK